MKYVQYAVKVTFTHLVVHECYYDDPNSAEAIEDVADSIRRNEYLCPQPDFFPVTSIGVAKWRDTPTEEYVEEHGWPQWQDGDGTEVVVTIK